MIDTGQRSAAVTSCANVPALASFTKACLSALYANSFLLRLVHSLHVVQRVESIHASSTMASSSSVATALGAEITAGATTAAAATSVGGATGTDTGAAG